MLASRSRAAVAVWLAAAGLFFLELAPAIAEAEEGKHGMPQLDFRTAPSQIFWLFFSFALLYWLLRRKALPQVTEILETRQQRITADLDAATRIRADAEAALTRYEQLLEEAHQKAGHAIRTAHERVVADLAVRQAALDRDLGQKITEAEKRIAAARESAMAQLVDVSAEAAQAALQRLAGIEISAAEARSAVEAVRGEAR
jgi:F-type H+-transporting ATPase subunit b